MEKPTKYLIIHADDLGMCHSINLATFHANEERAITSASTMVPCAWYSEVIDYARARTSFDLGIHLTVTSESRTLRWRPVDRSDRSDALLDPDGFFWASAHELYNLRASAFLSELRSQISLFLASGLLPSHLDTHMYALLFGSDSFRALLQAASEFGIPAFILPAFRLGRTASEIDTKLNHLIAYEYTAHRTLEPHQWRSFYYDTVQSLKPGVSQLTVHLGYDCSELQAAMGKDSAWGSEWRQRDLDLIMSSDFRALLAQCDVRLINWRDARILFDSEALSL